VIEEEKGGFLLAGSFEFQATCPSSASTLVAIFTPVSREAIHFIKERVFAQIGEEGKTVNPSRWVINIGATNHMMGTPRRVLRA
jgi:hypothetical protein